MNEEPHLSVGAGVFLLTIGILTDGAQFLLDLIGIGILLDPIISFVATLIFWITLQHNDIPMFGSRNGWSGWAALGTELVPVFDALPAWTTYAVFLMFSYRER